MPIHITKIEYEGKVYQLGDYELQRKLIDYYLSNNKELPKIKIVELVIDGK